jgi:hypothetical protein
MARPTGRGVACFVLTSGHTVAAAVGQKAIYDVPVPGQTVVTPLADVRRFLADTGRADLIECAPIYSSGASR